MLTFFQCDNREVPENMTNIIETARDLRRSNDASKLSLAASLSTRQLTRIARRMQLFGDEMSSPYQEVSRACLSR